MAEVMIGIRAFQEGDHLFVGQGLGRAQYDFRESDTLHRIDADQAAQFEINEKQLK